jgi:hypothetical protein
MIYSLRSTERTAIDYDSGEIVCNDQQSVLVDCTFEEASQLATDWNCKPPLIASAGKHIAESGDFVYIDDNGQMVQSATEVIEMENLINDVGLSSQDHDDVLHAAGLIF